MGWIQVHANGMWTWKAPALSWPLCGRYTCQTVLLLLPLLYCGVYYQSVLDHGTFGPHNSYTYFTQYHPPTPYPDDVEAAIMADDWWSHDTPTTGSDAGKELLAAAQVAADGDGGGHTSAAASLGVRPRPRVVVTLSTLPHRMESINETLRSLVAQSLRADAIYVAVPWVSRRMNVSYVVPDGLASWSDITVIRCDDFGPATKLIPALQAEPDPDTIVITVDDDHVYPLHFLRHLVWYAQRDPAVTWTVNGWAFMFAPGRHDVYTVYAPSEAAFLRRGTGLYVDVCQAVNGVAYRRGFFGDLQTLIKPHSTCFTTDDMWFSGFLAAHGVRRVMMPRVPASVDAKDAEWRVRERELKSAKAAKDRSASLSFHNKKNNQDIRCIDGIRETFGKPWPVVHDYEPHPIWR